jgi:hypothetical protein
MAIRKIVATLLYSSGEGISPRPKQKDTSMTVRLFNAAEVAEQLGVSDTTLKCWHKDKTFPAPFENRLGCPLFRQEDIDAIKPEIATYAAMRKKVVRKHKLKEVR